MKILMDDVEALHELIKDPEKTQKIFSEQIKLIYQHMPYAFLGAIIPTLLFFLMMYFTMDLNFIQKILNIGWVIYLNLSVALCWFWWHNIYNDPNHLSMRLIKTVVVSYASLLLVLDVVSIAAFLRFWFYAQDTFVSTLLLIVFIIFHSMALILCWNSWRKIKKINHLNNLVIKTQLGEYTLSAAEKKQTTSNIENNANYLANYLGYRLLLICAFTVGSLWSLTISKVVLTNIQGYTQVITMMGIHFGIMGGAISSIGTFWRVYIALALPSMLAWCVTLTLLKEPRLLLLAITLLLLLSFTIIFSKHTWLYTLKTIMVYMENKDLVNQLRHQSKLVEQASLAKTQFLAAASHDLRQPVHALSLFLETLSATPLNLHQTNIVNYAKTASQSSREMLNTILDYAHLESGKMSPNFVVTDLNHQIQNLMDEFGMQAQQKNLSLRYHATDVTVMSDPAMLSLILRNFLSNALRYTSKGGVLFGVHELPSPHTSEPYEAILQKFCRISVWDTGSGLTDSEMKQIFESFHQLARNNKNGQGLGLGLSIAQGMAVLLGTHIRVRSKLGKGSQFSVDLPIYNALYTKDMTVKPIRKQSLTGLTILVVDDEQAVLLSMQLLLTTWGCEVFTALSVKSAQLAASIQSPDIVITDYRLTDGETGENVIHAIQRQSLVTTPAFVMLTGNTSPELVQTTLNLNISILHKPIAPKTLKTTLQKVASTIKTKQ